MALSYRPPQGRFVLERGEIAVFLVPLAASRACFADFERSLVAEERDRARRFRTPALQESFVIARGTLRAMLGRCLGVAPADVPLAYGEHGKPRIAGEGTVRFNLSHSAGHALYALCLDREMGVDLERIQPADDWEEIARRYFSAGEADELMGLPREQRHGAFFTCWTRKEAYIKARGEGLSLPLESFRVSLAPSEPPRLETPLDGRAWSLFDASPEPGYAAALAAEGTPAALRAWRFANADDCAGYFR